MVSVWVEGAALQHSLGWLCLSCSGFVEPKRSRSALILPAQLQNISRASPSTWCSQPSSGKHSGLNGARVTHPFAELANGLTPNLGYTPSSL